MNTSAKHTETNQQTFSLWATSDAHVIREANADSQDPLAVPRQSLAGAIEQAEGPEGFPYDIALHLGDLIDFDYETEESYRTYIAQLAKSHKGRHAWYHLGGNNDENSVLNDGVSIDNEYYRKVIDPTGEFPETSGVDNSKRPFPVTGTYERYHFDVGNMRYLVLSDRNDLPAPYGRGEGGFYVDGAITLESFQWLVDQVIKNPDRILAVLCHHPLKNTTISSGIDECWEQQYLCGYDPNNRNKPESRLMGVLHQVYDVDPYDSPKFHNLLGQNIGVVDMWLSGHVHHRVEELYNGRGKYAHVFGGHHFNIGTLCRFRHHANIISAQSTLFSFTEGCEWFDSKVYIHDHPTLPAGFYAPEKRRLTLKKPFSRQFDPQSISAPTRNVDQISVSKLAAGLQGLSWRNTGTGLLIVRKIGAPPQFVPQDGQAYYAGESVNDAEVVFMGVNEQVAVASPGQDETVYYKAFAYNAGSDQIRFFPGDAFVRKNTT